MTKKDYELIASTILDWQKYATVQNTGGVAATVDKAHALNLVDMLMQKLHDKDPKFSDTKFAAACGLSGDFL